MEQEAQVRYRLWFGKDGALRYTSHLDLARTWERTLRRAHAPLVYSQGFNPRPKIQLAAALPLGYASTCEMLDVWLAAAQAPSPEALLAQLQDKAPPGLTVTRIMQIALRTPALQTIVRTATYEVRIKETVSAEQIAQQIDSLMEESSLMRERRGKTYDLRPLIRHLALVRDSPLTLEMILTTSPHAGTGRPDEVLDALGLIPTQAHVTRTALDLEHQDPQG